MCEYFTISFFKINSVSYYHNMSNNTFFKEYLRQIA